MVCYNHRLLLSKHRWIGDTGNLFVVLFIIVVRADSEVAQLIRILFIGNHTDPISQTVLLQILFRQVFQVALGEVDIRVDEYFHLLLLECNVVAQVVGLASYFQMFM